MTVSEFLRNSWGGAVAGGVGAYLGTRVEPFNSHFWLAVLAAAGVGVLAGIIEGGARKIAARKRDL